MPTPWLTNEASPAASEQIPKHTAPNQIEQLMRYTAIFTNEYTKKPKATCVKYKKRLRQNDWQASWALAYNTTKNGRNTCLNTREILKLLSTLQANKKLIPELLWFNQYTLQLNKALKNKARKIYRLQRIINKNKQLLDEKKLENQQKIEDLQLENQDIKEKLDALKAIETSILQ